MIPYGKQNINDEDIQAVVDVLKSPMLTQGEVIPIFEKEISTYVDVQFAVAVNSATSALHISCLALELGPGDLLWTVPNSFVASANVGILCGATVDFVDIDMDTYIMSVSSLEEKLRNADLNGKLPKIVMPVHFGGQSADMKSIKQLSLQYGFSIIEDASHAIGADYLNHKVGSCQFSDITVFSFHPVKIITTGEGGCATTKNQKLYERLKLFRSHGVTRSTDMMVTKSAEPWLYDQIEIGFNYRLTDFQAALGLSQLRRIDFFVSERHRLAKIYHECLSDLEIILPKQFSKCRSAYHLFPIQVKNRKEVFNQLRAKKINVNVHYIPIHTQPFWNTMGFQVGDFPNSEEYYSRAISIPLYPSLSEKDQAHVISSLAASLID